MKALIVDDSRAMRSILRRTLSQEGFEVIEAEHGRAALEVIQAGPLPDVVLVDWHMPQMNGLEFVQSVRAERAFDAMPILVVTIETEMDRVEEALAAGCDEYLMKPFERESLVEKLELLGLDS